MTLVDLAATPALVAALAALALIDLRERRLPDRITLPLVAAGLGLGAWRAGGLPTAGILGAALGYAAFAALGAAHYRLRASDGLGRGDAKLLAAAGAWLGWSDLPLLVLLAALGALAFVAARAALRLPVRRDLAFGPWLAGAFLVLWVAQLRSMPGGSNETFAWIGP